MKCSGTTPCRSCMSRSQTCVFDDADRRVVISERSVTSMIRKHVDLELTAISRRLRDLERRATTSSRSPRSNNQAPFPITPAGEHDEQRKQSMPQMRAHDLAAQDRIPLINRTNPEHDDRSLRDIQRRPEMQTQQCMSTHECSSNYY